MRLRDRLAAWLIIQSSRLATPRYRARMHVALLRGTGREPWPALLAEAAPLDEAEETR